MLLQLMRAGRKWVRPSSVEPVRQIFQKLADERNQSGRAPWGGTVGPGGPPWGIIAHVHHHVTAHRVFSFLSFFPSTTFSGYFVTNVFHLNDIDNKGHDDPSNNLLLFSASSNFFHGVWQRKETKMESVLRCQIGIVNFHLFWQILTTLWSQSLIYDGRGQKAPPYHDMSDFCDKKFPCKHESWTSPQSWEWGDEAKDPLSAVNF